MAGRAVAIALFHQHSEMGRQYAIVYTGGMAPKIDPDKYIRIGTAAAIAGVTRAYLHRLIDQGRFPAVTIDGQKFVRREDAEKYGKN